MPEQFDKENGEGGRRSLSTLILDLIERITIQEQNSKFADLQRIEIAADIKKLLFSSSDAAKREDLEKLQEKLMKNKERIDAHERILNSTRWIGTRVITIFTAILASACTVLFEWYLGRLK